MRVLIYVLALVMSGGFLAAPVRSEAPKVVPDNQKPSRYRLKGMKAALADIEAGKLQLRTIRLPGAEPPWRVEYARLLKKECGVELEFINVDLGETVDEMGGYNDVMTVEIEHRFGKGIVEKLEKKADPERGRSKPKE